MYPDKPNRFWLLSGLLLAIVFTVAFRTGELVELESYVDRQSDGDIIKTTQTVQFIVPKGTDAQVFSANRLESGNYALELLVAGSASEGKGAGRHVWVLYRPAASGIVVGDARGLATAEMRTAVPLAGHHVTFMRDTPAISRLVNPISETVAKSVETNGPPVEVDPKVSSAGNDAEFQREVEEGRWEKAMPISSLRGRGFASEGE